MPKFVIRKVFLLDVVLVLGVCGVIYLKIERDQERDRKAGMDSVALVLRDNDRSDAKRRQAAIQDILAQLKVSGAKSGAKWAGHIQGLKTANRMGLLTTDLKIEPVQREDYRSLCESASALALSHQYEMLGINRLAVVDGNGKQGAFRRQGQPSCAVFQGKTPLK